MATTIQVHSNVARTERGLVVAGTRITLYQIMDYLKADWPAKLIRDRLDLTDKQIHDVLEYIEGHREEVEAEHQQVLRHAEENRRRWEERNREVFDRIDESLPRDKSKEAWLKLKGRKERLGLA